MADMYDVRRGFHVERHTEQYRSVVDRQRRAVLLRVGRSPTLLDRERWDSVLAAVMLSESTGTATEFARPVAEQFDVDVDVDAMVPWLTEHTRIAAENINADTEERITGGFVDDGTAGIILAFRQIRDVATVRWAESEVTATANFGAHDTARKVASTKTWRTNSGRPRSGHAALNGVTVPIDQRFPNGMMWPGDPAGGAENVANCKCSLTFGS